MKVLYLKDTTYKTNPIIVGNCSLKTFEKFVQKQFPKYQIDRDDTIAGIYIMPRTSTDAQRYVWVKNLKKDPESLAALIHELLHLVVRILGDKGIPIADKAYVDGTDFNLDEVAAYLLESFSCQVFEKLNLT